MLSTGYESGLDAIRNRPSPGGLDAIRLILKGLARVASEPSSQRLPSRPSHWLTMALVIERPGHAYELGARYERRFGSFAPTAPNAVYSTLDRLHERRLVTTSVATRAQGRRSSIRTVYEATQAGVEAHRCWLLSSIKPRHWRTEILARLATGTSLPRGDLLALVALYEHMTKEHSQQIDKPPKVGKNAKGPEILVRQLVAQEQASITHAQLAWAKHAREETQRLPV